MVAQVRNHGARTGLSAVGGQWELGPERRGWTEGVGPWAYLEQMECEREKHHEQRPRLWARETGRKISPPLRVGKPVGEAGLVSDLEQA